MDIQTSRVRTGLVLPGGGARGAFQVGVLRAIADMLPHGAPNPFPVISGTSAGAVNSVVLASRARRFRVAVAELNRVWSHFKCEHVFRADNWTMFRSSLHWLGAIVLGGTFVGTPTSLLDNSPLRDLLSRNVRFPRIQDAIDHGYLDAVAVTAAGYSSARSTSFFQAASDTLQWSRTRRIGVRRKLNLDHLMASIAVPMVFPPVLIEHEYFGDGAMRQATPLSSAVHLGADRILVIGIRNETGSIKSATGEPLETSGPPSFAHIAGYMLDTLFMDGLYSDLERLTRVNQLIDAVPQEQRGGAMTRVRPIDTMVVVPSRDLREVAHEHVHEMPRSVRALLRGVGGRSDGGANRLVSFLLFEQGYTQALIELGYQDAMAVKDELLAFVSGAPVPRLFAPNWVRQDLTEPLSPHLESSKQEGGTETQE